LTAKVAISLLQRKELLISQSILLTEKYLLHTIGEKGEGKGQWKYPKGLGPDKD
jgi:hypothetical protein